MNKQNKNKTLEAALKRGIYKSLYKSGFISRAQLERLFQMQRRA